MILSLSACDGKKDELKKQEAGSEEQADKSGAEAAAEMENQPEAKASESEINSGLPPQRLNGAKQRVDGAEKALQQRSDKIFEASDAQ